LLLLPIAALDLHTLAFHTKAFCPISLFYPMSSFDIASAANEHLILHAPSFHTAILRPISQSFVRCHLRDGEARWIP
jgi:hypothetical protein